MVLESVKIVIQVKILLIVYCCMWDLAEISENLNSLDSVVRKDWCLISLILKISHCAAVCFKVSNI